MGSHGLFCRMAQADSIFYFAASMFVRFFKLDESVSIQIAANAQDGPSKVKKGSRAPPLPLRVWGVGGGGVLSPHPAHPFMHIKRHTLSCRRDFCTIGNLSISTFVILLQAISRDLSLLIAYTIFSVRL